MNIMVRMYTFHELMHRLTSPDWGVEQFGHHLVFIPNIYRDSRKNK